MARARVSKAGNGVPVPAPSERGGFKRPDECAAAFANIVAGLETGKLLRKPLDPELLKSLLNFFEIFRKNDEAMNVLRCLYKVITSPTELSHITEIDYKTVTSHPQWPFKQITREIVGNIKSGETTRPHIHSILSLLYFLFVLREEHHPIIRESLPSALLVALPELEAFQGGKAKRDAERLRTRRRSQELYALLGDSDLPRRIESVPSTRLFGALDHDENQHRSAMLTAVRLSTRGPAGHVGFVVSLVDLTFVPSGHGGREAPYIFVKTRSGRNPQSEIRSSGFVVANRSNDIYFLQYQPERGGFNISAFPSAQSDLPGGFARGVILIYDALNNEGPMVSRIAVIPGANIKTLVNDAGWSDTKTYLESIEDCCADFDQMLQYLAKVEVSVEVTYASETSDEDGVSQLVSQDELLSNAGEQGIEGDNGGRTIATYLQTPLTTRQPD